MECVPRQAVNPSAVTGTSPPDVQLASTGVAAPVAPEQTTPVSVPAPATAPASAPAPTPTQAVNCPNVVTIPVPIVSQEDIYTYVSIKGSLHDRTCALFGLDDAEVLALSKRFDNGSTQIVNGVMINAPPMQIINTLSQLGYKVVCSTGEAEIVWTMQREV